MTANKLHAEFFAASGVHAEAYPQLYTEWLENRDKPLPTTKGGAVIDRIDVWTEIAALTDPKDREVALTDLVVSARRMTQDIVDRVHALLDRLEEEKEKTKTAVEKARREQADSDAKILATFIDARWNSIERAFTAGEEFGQCHDRTLGKAEDYDGERDAEMNALKVELTLDPFPGSGRAKKGEADESVQAEG